MHLATRGNNKILRTPPPHINISVEILPRLTHRTLAQLRTNKSPFLKSYLHKVDAKSHPSPLCPLCNTHTYDTHHLFNCTHIRTTFSRLVDTPSWSDGTAGQMDREDGWWASRGNIGLPPLARVKGVGRTQQHVLDYLYSQPDIHVKHRNLIHARMRNKNTELTHFHSGDRFLYDRGDMK